jgi:hypothetical protein
MAFDCLVDFELWPFPLLRFLVSSPVFWARSFLVIVVVIVLS